MIRDIPNAREHHAPAPAPPAVPQGGGECSSNWPHWPGLGSIPERGLEMLRLLIAVFLFSGTVLGAGAASPAGAATSAAPRLVVFEGFMRST